MSIENIVQATVTIDGQGITRKGFGVPLIVGKHTAWADRYRIYNAGTASDDLVTDGIPKTSPIQKQVISVISQSPKVKQIAIGRLVTSYNQLTSLTILDATEGAVIEFTLRSPSGVATEISYTVLPAATTTDVAAAIAALINAVTDITATSALAVVSSVADNADESWYFEGYDLLQLGFSEDTIDTSLATEIGEINNLYSGWYGLILADCPSKARLLACAGYTEVLEKLHVATTYDTENTVTGTTDSIQAALKAASYSRTAAPFSGDQTAGVGAAWQGEIFPFDPGASTWVYKTLAGVTVDTLSASHTAAMDANNGSYYMEVEGLNVTLGGKVGSGEWIDVIRFRDWLLATIRSNVGTILMTARKVPFTNKGISLVVKEIKSAISEGITKGGIDAEGDNYVTFPDVIDVPAANKVSRILPDIRFQVVLSGAIHATIINGVLKV